MRHPLPKATQTGCFSLATLPSRGDALPVLSASPPAGNFRRGAARLLTPAPSRWGRAPSAARLAPAGRHSWGTALGTGAPSGSCRTHRCATLHRGLPPARSPCPSPLGRTTFQGPPALSRHWKRRGSARLGSGRAGVWGAYLMSPLGCRAGQRPRGPLHARGAALPAHTSSSSFLPAGSASFPRPGGAGAALAVRPARQRGKEEQRGGRQEQEEEENEEKEEKESRGRETTSCALLSPPQPLSGHRAAADGPRSPAESARAALASPAPLPGRVSPAPGG